MFSRNSSVLRITRSTASSVPARRCLIATRSILTPSLSPRLLMLVFSPSIRRLRTRRSVATRLPTMWMRSLTVPGATSSGLRRLARFLVQWRPRQSLLPHRAVAPMWLMILRHSPTAAHRSYTTPAMLQVLSTSCSSVSRARSVSSSARSSGRMTTRSVRVSLVSRTSSC